MKEKVLYLIIGVLLGAIVTTGVFMIINKNDSKNAETNNFRNGRPMFTGDGQPPNLEGAQREVMEDGTVRYTMPDGRTVQQRTGSGGQNGPGSRTMIMTQP